MSTLDHAPASDSARPRRPEPRRPGGNGGRRSSKTPVSGPAGRVLALQRQAGNAAVAGMLAPQVDREDRETAENSPRRGDARPTAPPAAPADAGTESSDTGADESPETREQAGGSPGGSGGAPPGGPPDGKEGDRRSEATPPAQAPAPKPSSLPTDEAAVEAAVAEKEAESDEAQEPADTQAAASEPESVSDAVEPPAGPAVPTGTSDPAADAVAPLHAQEGRAHAAIAAVQAKVMSHSAGLAPQISDAVASARRALVKNYAITLAELAGLATEYKSQAVLEGLEAQAQMGVRRERQKRSFRTSRTVMTGVLDVDLAQQAAKADAYAASRRDWVASQARAQRVKMENTKNAHVHGWGRSRKIKEIRKLSDKAWRRLRKKSVDVQLALMGDLRKKSAQVKSQLLEVRAGVVTEMAGVQLELDTQLDKVGMDPSKGLVEGAMPFVHAGSRAAEEVERGVHAAAAQGMQTGLLPAMRLVGAMGRAAMAGVGPATRRVLSGLSYFAEVVRRRFVSLRSAVRGARGRRARRRAAEMAADFGAIVATGALRGATWLGDRFDAWVERMIGGPARAVEAADFAGLVSGTRGALVAMAASLRIKLAAALDKVEAEMAKVVAPAVGTLGELVSKSRTAVANKVSDQLGKLDQKLGQAIGKLDHTADTFKGRLRKASMQLYDSWFSRAWNRLWSGIKSALSKLWKFIKGLLKILLIIAAAVVVIIVVVALALKLTIAAAAIMVAGAIATALATTVVKVALIAITAYTVYKAAKGGWENYKKVADDPLATDEEIGAAVGGGLADIAVEFIPLKLPKPLQRLADKAMKGLKKLAERGRRGTGGLDDVDDLAGGGRRADDVEDAAGGGSKAPDEAPKPGDALSDDLLVSHYGVPPAKAKQMQSIAAKHNVKIWARPSTPHAPARMAEGAVPKIESVKAKTLNETDLMLGKFDEADLGKVAYFKPELPPRPKGMSDEAWEKVTERFVERLEEFHNEAEAMEYLSKDPATRGAKPDPDMREPGNDRVLIEDGIVKVVDESGASHVQTGDIDLYDLAKADDSAFKRIDDPQGVRDEFEAIMDELVEAGLVEHGAHLRWRTRSAKEARIKQTITEAHEGGKHLIEFGPSGTRLATASDVPGHASALEKMRKESPGTPDAGPRFVVTADGNVVDLEKIRSLKKVDSPGGSRSGHIPNGGRGEPNTFYVTGDSHAVIFGKDGRAILTVSKERIKVIEWNQVPGGELKMGKRRKTDIGTVPAELLRILGLAE